MPSDWYVVIDGKSCGPLDDSRIKALKREGQITPETLVCRAGMKQWVPARRVKGLFSDSQAPATQDAPRRTVPVEVTPSSDPVFDTVADPAATATVVTHASSASHGQTVMLKLDLITALGLSGTAALVMGFFCPILRLPIIGTLSYLGFIGLMIRKGAVSEMTISAVLVLVAIAAAIVVAVIRKPLGYWIPGGLAACAALLTCVKYFGQMSQMQKGMKKDLQGNPFAGLAEAMIQTVSLDFGFGIVVIGAALLIAAAVVPVVRRS